MFLIASKLLFCSCTLCFYLFGALFVSDFFCLLIFVYLMLFMGIYLEYGWNICTFKGLPLLNYSIGCQALISVYPGLMFPSLLQLEWSITFSPAITTIYVPPSTCFPEPRKVGQVLYWWRHFSWRQLNTSFSVYDCNPSLYLANWRRVLLLLCILVHMLAIFPQFCSSISISFSILVDNRIV